jgi:hypothetical protein
MDQLRLHFWYDEHARRHAHLADEARAAAQTRRERISRRRRSRDTTSPRTPLLP